MIYIRTNFRKMYGELCYYYNEVYNEKKCKLYYCELKTLGATRIEALFKEARRTLKFFPKISELLEIERAMPPEWFFKKCLIDPLSSGEEKELVKILDEIGG